MWLSLLLAAATAAAPSSNNGGASSAIAVKSTVPEDAGAPVLRPFVSFSIEFAFFPDFAGIDTPAQSDTLRTLR